MPSGFNSGGGGGGTALESGWNAQETSQTEAPKTNVIDISQRIETVALGLAGRRPVHSLSKEYLVRKGCARSHEVRIRGKRFLLACACPESVSSR